MAKTTKKYFIIKDFIGYPVNIVSADYTSTGHKVNGHYLAPRVASKKYPGFDSLEEIEKYKMCSCGKDDCRVNYELRMIVSGKFKKETDENKRPYSVHHD